jgi:hypothetical protein
VRANASEKRNILPEDDLHADGQIGILNRKVARRPGECDNCFSSFTPWILVDDGIHHSAKQKAGRENKGRVLTLNSSRAAGHRSGREKVGSAMRRRGNNAQATAIRLYPVLSQDESRADARKPAKPEEPEATPRSQRNFPISPSCKTAHRNRPGPLNVQC